MAEGWMTFVLFPCFMQDDGQFGQGTYGVCFVDTTIGKFQVF